MFGPLRTYRGGPFYFLARCGRFLVGGNSSVVTISRNGAIDRGRLIAGGQPVGAFSRAHDAVVTPDVVGFAIQEVDRLKFPRRHDGDEEITHGADILDIKYDAIGRGFFDVHSVDGFTGKVIDL